MLRVRVLTFLHLLSQLPLLFYHGKSTFEQPAKFDAPLGFPMVIVHRLLADFAVMDFLAGF
jgi:hypothetical protein